MCARVHVCVCVHACMHTYLINRTFTKLIVMVISIILNGTGKPTKDTLQRIATLLPDKLTVHITVWDDD